MAEPRRRLQPRAERTRQRLLDATICTLIEHGYAATSMPRLCDRAGLSRGAQLHHFPTKAALLAASIEHLMVRRLEELRATLEDESGGDKADAFVDQLWKIYSGPTFYAWLELAVVARTDPELRASLAEVNDRFYARAHEILRELFDLGPEANAQLPALARFVTSVMDGVAVNRILDDDDTMTNATLVLFKHAIAGWFSSFTKKESK